jgi:tagatose-1,6-bisphosphate aldolase
MSPKKAHRTTVRKYNRKGYNGGFCGRMWWAECTCGWFQGEHEKQEAQRLADEHEEKEVNS